MRSGSDLLLERRAVSCTTGVEVNKHRKRRRKRKASQPNRQRLAPKGRWIAGTIMAVVFGCSLVPYAMDLSEHPEAHNAILLCLGTAIFVASIVLVLRHL